MVVDFFVLRVAKALRTSNELLLLKRSRDLGVQYVEKLFKHPTLKKALLVKGIQIFKWSL